MSDVAAEVAPAPLPKKNTRKRTSAAAAKDYKETVSDDDDAAAGVAPAAPSKKTTKKRTSAAAAKDKQTKKIASHPTYQQMIKMGIKSLKERNGSSKAAILKYILHNYKVGDNNKQINAHLRLAINRGVQSGTLQQVKGHGASGSFRLGDKDRGTSPTDKKEKPKRKPTATKKTPAAPTEKKTKTAKPKKATTPKKAKASPAKKKTPAKKSPAKKSVAAKSPKPKSPKAKSLPKKKPTPKKKTMPKRK